MEETLTTRYKPTQLEHFYLDDKSNNIIETLLSLNSLNLLIVGESGTGKTSLVNTIVSLYYADLDFPKNDIMMITSLQDQGITFYRNDVRTFCQTPSSLPGKKKIMIIDNLDTVNDQSQQVFRNCIDKYHHNVQFLATCVNMQKIIESLQSRLNIIRIPRMSGISLLHIAKQISQAEGIKITNDSMDFICKASSNVSTLINYIEKFRLLDKKITLKDARDLCTNINYSSFDSYNELCKQEKMIAAAQLLYKHVDDGFSVMDVLDSYFGYIKTLSSIDQSYKYKLIPVICKYMAMFHCLHEDEVELLFFTNDVIDIFTS